jgi:uncharacterized protein
MCRDSFLTLVLQTVKWIRATFPNRPIFAIGFSLGANILTNVSVPIIAVPASFINETQYVGEEGEDCVLKAAISCSNPFDLEVSHKTLSSSLFGKAVYQRVMGCKFSRSLARKLGIHQS